MRPAPAFLWPLALLLAAAAWSAAATPETDTMAVPG